jgi:AGZA family xanthine/uracil permease-like MFS transporter
MEHFFKLKENGTKVSTEVIAGITTFVTMAYIIFVNPNILGITGMDKEAVMFATCIGAFIGTVLIGLLANYPFAQAPGMGLNAFFAFTICGSLGFSWQAGLAAVFMSGVIFIIITLTGLREAIVKGIPSDLKRAISAGIGLFIAYIGIKGANFLSFTIDPGRWFATDPDPTKGTVIGDASAIPALSFSSPTAILAIIGLILCIILVVKKVRGALLIGIVGTSIVGAFMQFALGYNVGMTVPESFHFPNPAPTFGKFLTGFGDLFNMEQGLAAVIFSIIAVIISLTLVDLFDNIGTLIGTAAKAGLLDENGNLPRAGKALMADAIATTVGSVLGTSTVTTYVESGAGASAGGKTGLTSMVTAVFFLFSLFLAPCLGLVPGSATAPVLIIVGIMMASALKDIDWTDFRIAVPCFATVVMMPLAYSISEGIAWGFILYVVVNLVSGKAKKIGPVMWVFAALFIIRYILLMTNLVG